MDTQDELMATAMAELQTLIADWAIERKMQPLAVAAILMATSTKIYNEELNQLEFDALMDSVKASMNYNTDRVMH